MPAASRADNDRVADEQDSPGALARWLGSPAGTAARQAAATALTQADGDPLHAASLLRNLRRLTPAEASAALEQATLSRQAQRRAMTTERTGDLLLTRDGLEAGTRPAVAAHRADVIRASGAQRVLDLTGGLGFDSRAFLDAGLAVIAVERDPVVGAMLAFNCPDATVVQADATQPGALDGLLSSLDPTDVVFVDPARRYPEAARDAITARARPERDPEKWSPPWSWVASIPHPRVAAKVAPGFRPSPDWQAQWISADRTVVECSLYSWPATRTSRSAVLVRDGAVVDAVAEGPALAVTGTLDAWLIEPDPALTAAGAIGSLPDASGLAWLGEGSSWLTGPASPSHPGLRGYRVLSELRGSSRQRRRQLEDLGVTHATVKSRDGRMRPAEVLSSLGITEGLEHVIVVTRCSGRTVTVVTEPVHLTL